MPNKEYYYKNRDRLIAYTAAYQKAHPDKVREYNKRWREKYKEYCAEYRRKNAKYLNDMQQQRVRFKLTAARAAMGGKCQLCGAVEDLEFAHLYYTDKETRQRQVCKRGDNVKCATEILKEGGNRFLLLCYECHHHPEPYLKLLIDNQSLLESRPWKQWNELQLKHRQNQGEDVFANRRR